MGYGDYLPGPDSTYVSLKDNMGVCGNSINLLGHFMRSKIACVY